VNASNRFLVSSLVFLAVGLTVVSSVRPGWTRELGLQGASEAPEEVSQGVSSPADPSFAPILARVRAKERLSERVADGKLGLFEAAAWFGFLNETPAGAPDAMWREGFEGGCDGEKLCRQVLCWTKAALEKKPPRQARARINELENELETHICRHGKVDLPGR
jgi:hypothetical protein